MTFAFLPFPYLHSYSLVFQFTILLAFAALSYRYRSFRLALLGFLGIYTAYKTTVPLVRWGYAAFKAIAMFGFYVHFFIIGAGYIFYGATAVWNYPGLLQSFRDGFTDGNERASRES
ncbi:hypothetical protein K438DRAFT_1613420 [Mycena galopus ATCC 62051]|nr:hypothetical protein K438DRAFT_1613420 [Mycena galopus ATCC 62051]